MSSNEKERNNHSRGHGPMRVSEKPKDFMGSIKKLMKSHYLKNQTYNH